MAAATITIHMICFYIVSISGHSNQGQIISQISFPTHQQTIVPNIIYGVRIPGQEPRPKTPAFRWSAREIERTDQYINRVLSRKVDRPPTAEQRPQSNMPANHETPTNQSQTSKTLRQNADHQNAIIQRKTQIQIRHPSTSKRPQIMMNVAKSVINMTPKTEPIIPATPRPIISIMNPLNIIASPKDPHSVEIEANLIVLETSDHDEVSFPSNRRRVEKVIVKHANQPKNGSFDDELIARSDNETSQPACTCQSSPNAKVVILSLTSSLIAIMIVIGISSRYILRYKRKCENQDEIVRAECVRVEGFGSHRLMFDPRV